MASLRPSTAKSPPPWHRLGATGEGWVGDLLFISNGIEGARSWQGRMGERSSRVWVREAWSLHATGPGASWKGFPFLSVEHDPWSVWFLGQLYGEGRPSEDCLEVLEGTRSPVSLNGHFLLAGYDRESRELTLITDRFGTLHAYYSASGKRAAVGTWFPAVAAVASSRRLDWIGLTGLFGVGFFPADSTFYGDVKILKPASRYVFDECGALISQERYWSWPEAPVKLDSHDEALEAFAPTFLDVMGEMLAADRVALPISGGLDSRSTVAAIEPHSMNSDRIWSFSYGYDSRSVETAIGCQVARARGLSHSSYEIRPYLFENLPTVVDCVEGFQDITQCRQAAVLEELARHAEWLVAAHWGDVWLDSAGAGEAVADKDLAQLALGKMWKRGGDWLVKNLCVSRLGDDDPRGLLRESLVRQLESIPGDHEPDFRLKALKTDTWAFRWTLTSLRMYQAAAFPLLPFFDSRLTDIVGGISSSLLEGRRLQIEFLRRYAPDLARIKWQTYDANLYAYDRFSSWQVPKRILKKAVRMLRRQRPIERNWEVQLLGEVGQQGLDDWLLRKDLPLHDLLPPEQIEGLLARFRAHSRDPELGYTVSMLLTFSAWLELHG